MSEDVAFRTAHGWLRSALIRVEDTLRRDIDVIGAVLGLVLMAPLFLMIEFVVAVDGVFCTQTCGQEQQDLLMLEVPYNEDVQW